MTISETLQAYEQNQLTDVDVAPTFQRLIDDGTIWTLPEPFPHMAEHLIELNFCHSYVDIPRDI